MVDALIANPEPIKLDRLIAEGLHRADVGKRLFGYDTHLALLRLDLHLLCAHPFGKELGEDDEWDNASESNTHQCRRDKQHDEEGEYDEQD